MRARAENEISRPTFRDKRTDACNILIDLIDYVINAAIVEGNQRDNNIAFAIVCYILLFHNTPPTHYTLHIYQHIKTLQYSDNSVP